MLVSTPTTVRALAGSLSALVLTLLTVSQTRAGFVPLLNESKAYSKSKAGSVVSEISSQAPPSSFNWDGQAVSGADNWPYSEAYADYQVPTYSIHDSCLVAVGEGTASGWGPAAPYSNEGHGMVSLFFMVNQTQEYTADLHVYLNDLPARDHFIELRDRNMNRFWRHDIGATSIVGRLATGSYWLFAKTDYYETAATGVSAEFSAFMCFASCASIIGDQPDDQTWPPGGTIDLQVWPASSAQSAQVVTTYQWRRNLQNLTDGGRVSGATTAQLNIANAALADSGLYDCVVTQGTVVEPSRQAEVRVQPTTAVEPTLAASDLRLAAPRPNPFVDVTRLEFALARAGRVSLAVFDALGRRVKELVPSGSLSPGRYAVDWNGTDAQGRRVPGGVYFVHLLANGTRRLQRAVLMPGGR